MRSITTGDIPEGQALKVERVLARASLTRVALAVGISAGYLSRIESGERTASPELLEKIRVAIRASRAAA